MAIYKPPKSKSDNQGFSLSPMEINGPPPTTMTPRQIRAAVNAWQIGQIMHARVVRQATPQAVLLQVDNQQLLAKTHVQLAAGQRLELTVTQLGDKPVLQARLLGAAAPTNLSTATPGRADNSSATIQTAVNALLKQALPQQASMAGLLANLSQLNSQAGRLMPLPPAVEAIAKQLYRQLPTADKSGNVQQLKQNIANSGIFLESRLAKNAVDTGGMQLKQALQHTVQTGGEKPAPGAHSATAGDLKANLLRLLGAVQQAPRVSAPQASAFQSSAAASQPLATPPPLRGQAPQAQARAAATLQQLGTLQLLLQELGRQTEAALARTLLHQAASLPPGEQTPNSWAFELPLRNGQQIDIFDVVIEEDTAREQGEEDGNPPWSVTLAFNLNGLGPVYARLRLIKDKVSTLFWAENAHTSQLFKQHLADLSQRYRAAGLEPGELGCFQGTPPGTGERAAAQIVLDIKA